MHKAEGCVWQHVNKCDRKKDTDPSPSLVVACHDDLFLLHSKRKRLEVRLFTLKDAGVEAVLVEGE